MNSDKKRRLETAGWLVDDATGFLQLSEEEIRLLDLSLTDHSPFNPRLAAEASPPRRTRRDVSRCPRRASTGSWKDVLPDR